MLRLFIIAAVLPGGLVLALLFAAAGAVTKIASADPTFSPAFRVLFWARVWTLIYGVPFPLSLAVLRNEGASAPHTLRAREQDAISAAGGDPPDTGYPVGDLGDARGPSVGPGQVLRSNVEALWNGGQLVDRTPVSRPAFILRPLVTAPHPTDLVRVGFERQALWAHVAVLRAYLSGGDVRQAARRYNGSGAAAEAYAARAADFITSLET